MKNIFIILALVLSVSTTFGAEKEKKRGLNPDVGANFLTLFKRSSNPYDANNGFNLQEAEIQFEADVDPYFSAITMFAIEQENGQWGVTPEEVYAQTTFIPHLTLKAGRFFVWFGKHNQMHEHTFPFIDAPLSNVGVFGEDSLNESGVAASYLIPLNWFSELTVQAITNSNEALFRDGASTGVLLPGDMAYVGRFRNLWDLNDDTTFEFGVSGLNGKNNYSAQTNVFGADLTLKHKASDRGVGRLWMAGVEGIQANRNEFTVASPVKAFGFSAFTQYEFLARTFAQYRYDGYVSDRRHTVLLGYAPSEFSMFRAQYSSKSSPGLANEHTVLVQFNFAVGAHPAHEY